MTQTVFLFGPLCDAEFAEVILHKRATGPRALLHDYRLGVVAPSIMPCLVPEPGASVDGMVVAVDAPALARLDTFFGLHSAERLGVVVEGAGTKVAALAYQVGRQPSDPVSTGWTEDQAQIMHLATAEIMGLADRAPIAALHARWPMALAHAASQVRARKGDDPAQLRKDWTRDDVELVHGAMPYAWYFAVAEDDLRFRQFDGAFSAVVKRAGLVMSDAVTVLPYDPVRDMVMVIEQFRFGPWLRGAGNAWLLEPIAGRVDPFESPQDCALREAQEEARITLRSDALMSVGHVYPSPGAITEFLYQFVALCDLPEGSDGVAGLESEAEDIRSHIVPFDRLMALIASGEVQNGPLVQSAYWLALNRDRLRADAVPQDGG